MPGWDPQAAIERVHSSRHLTRPTRQRVAAHSDQIASRRAMLFRIGSSV